jgi:LacI family transcriptional regulator
MLGLIVSEITNPFFPELVQEFENLAVAQGYEVLIGSTNYDPERTESLIRRMLQRNVDGVAVMTFGIEEDLVKKLVEREFPLVFVDAGPNLPNIRVLKVNYGEGFARRCSTWPRSAIAALPSSAARCACAPPWPGATHSSSPWPNWG